MKYFVNDTKRYITNAVYKHSASAHTSYVLDFAGEHDIAEFLKEFKGLDIVLLSSLKDDLSEKEYVPRVKQKILLFSNARSNKDAWTETEIDYEEGGVYLPIYIYSADVKNKYIDSSIDASNLTYLVQWLESNCKLKIDKLYGVKRAYVHKLNSKWINFSTLIEQAIESCNKEELEKSLDELEWGRAIGVASTIHTVIDALNIPEMDIASINDAVVKDLAALKSKKDAYYKYGYYYRHTNNLTNLTNLASRFGIDIKKLAASLNIHSNIYDIVKNFYEKYPIVRYINAHHGATMAPLLKEYVQLVEQRDEALRKLGTYECTIEEIK